VGLLPLWRRVHPSPATVYHPMLRSDQFRAYKNLLPLPLASTATTASLFIHQLQSHHGRGNLSATIDHHHHLSSDITRQPPLSVPWRRHHHDDPIYRHRHPSSPPTNIIATWRQFISPHRSTAAISHRLSTHSRHLSSTNRQQHAPSSQDSHQTWPPTMAAITSSLTLYFADAR